MTGPKTLRSHAWFGRPGRQGFEPRSMMRSLGLPDHAFDGRPVIGVCSVWSELNPCDSGQRALAEHVKMGVLEAGGLPLEFPGMAIGEPLMRPSPLMFRNLASMAIEELIRSNPLDGVVLLGGCDKTTPALLLGAASCDIPAIVVSSGPKISAHMRGKTIGSGTHIWQIESEVARGSATLQQQYDSEAAMSRSIGTCMTMGSASTNGAIVEAMGIALEGNCCIPAPDARRSVLARRAGFICVDAVKQDRRPSSLLTRAAFENAVRVVGAIGGSTNTVLHLLALARRLAVNFDLNDWDRLGRDVPCLVDLQPAGRFLMDDFYAAGGLKVVLHRLAERGLLNTDTLTIEGGRLGDRLQNAECFNDGVIRPFEAPVAKQGGLAILRGNLAPNGAVIKPAAATAALLTHTGKAVVFDDIDHYNRVIDDARLEVAADDILILRNCGPRGYPGMPEVGNFRLPAKILRQGVTDMVRLTDARMSGTAFGTIVLHIAPEAAVGGPLALVRTGDVITVDVPGRRLHAHLDANELERRRASWVSTAATPARGYEQLYFQHVQQADVGADFDFLSGASGAAVPRDST